MTLMPGPETFGRFLAAAQEFDEFLVARGLILFSRRRNRPVGRAGAESVPQLGPCPGLSNGSDNRAYRPESRGPYAFRPKTDAAWSFLFRSTLCGEPFAKP